MGRAPKKGLSYYPKTVDYYSDDKIMDLSDEYGPIGLTVYDVILTLIYTNGYYLEIPMDKLARIVRRTIGNRWIRDINLVIQVIDYCADIGLFNKGLLLQNIMTSEGIQRRYAEVTARNKVDKSKYWLLDIREASATDTEKEISATETIISATEIQKNDTDIQQNKTKQNKIELNKYSSCYSKGHINEKKSDNNGIVQNNVQNSEESEDESVEPFDMLSDRSAAILIERTGKLVFKYWSRRVESFDIKRAAGVLFILFTKKKVPFKELTDEHFCLLEEALMIAADADAKKWSYVCGIFRKWAKANIFTYDDYVKYSERRSS